MAGYVKPQVQGFVSKSTVIGEFVDEIPERKYKPENLKRTSWQAQEGVREALSKAFANPGKAMELVHYDQGAKSVRKKNAYLRQLSLLRQGYTEENGWIVRAVEEKVYVLYQGARG
jgi:hypothetical protein